MTTIVVTPPEGSNVLTELRRCLQALGSHGINAKGLVPGGRECCLIRVADHVKGEAIAIFFQTGIAVTPQTGSKPAKGNCPARC
jgi:hypothetical protein